MGHLHLVTDTTAAPRKSARQGSLCLTTDEARHLRASIRNIARARYASLAAMARELGIGPGVLTRKKRPSPALAVALWRLTGIPVEVLLSGKLVVVPSPGGAT
jgi:hypothetical protein